MPHYIIDNNGAREVSEEEHKRSIERAKKAAAYRQKVAQGEIAFADVPEDVRDLVDPPATPAEYQMALRSVGVSADRTSELENAMQAHLEETREALQTLYDELNPGQRRIISGKETIKALFDRYGVEY